MRVKTALILLMLAWVGFGAFTLSFPNGTLVTDPHTLTPAVTYSMSITFPTNTITAGSTVAIQFGYRYNITAATLANCQYSTSGASFQAGTCSAQTFGSGTSTTYIITYTGIYPSTALSQSALNIKFVITNPWGGGVGASENILVFINDAGSNVLGTGQSTIQFWPSIMNTCSYSSSSLVTGANSTKTISFTPIVPLIAGSSLQITMPLWFSNSFSNSPSTFSCSGITNSDSPSLTCSKQAFTATSTQTYTLTGFVNTNKDLTTAIVLEMSPLRNPWNTYVFGPISYQIINSGIVTQNCTGVSLTMSTPSTFANVIFALPSAPTLTTTYNNLMLRLQIRQPFPSSAFLKVSHPSTVSITLVGTASLASQNTTELIIGSAANVDLTSSFSFINLFNSFKVITPPTSRLFTLTFTSLYLNNGIYYEIDSSSVDYTPTTGTLTNAILTASSYLVNQQTTYTLTLTITNALISGSHITVLFPSTVTLPVSANCSADVPMTCSITNTSFADFTSTGTINAGTTITLTFNPVTNPDQAITISSLQVKTYYDSALDSLVDTATSGITLTSISRPLTNVTVTPSSLITFASTNYLFSLDLIDSIPATGNIVIIFPSTVTLSTVSLTTASFASSSCTVSSNSTTITLSSCFPVGLVSGPTTFTLTGIQNPPSLQPTTSISIQTAGPLGIVNYINSGLTLTMITPATSTSFSVAPTSSTVHATTSYTLSFTFAVPHLSGDYFTFSIDSSMAFISPVCTPVSGITSVSCATSNSSTLVITLTSAPQSSAQITITSIRNYDVTSTPIPYTCSFFNSGNYPMENTNTVTHSYTVDTLTPVTINNNDQIALYQHSNFTLTVNSPFAIHSNFPSNLTQLTLTLPTSFTADSTTICAASSGACTRSNNSFTITPVGLGLTSFTVLLGNILLPFITISSTSFSLAFQYNSLDIATINSGLIVSPFCTTPCQRCSGTQTICQSCLPAPNTAIYLYTTNSSCLNSCPPQLYPDSANLCTPCVSPCLQCLDAINCSTCVIDRWLFQTSCLLVCPNTYYNDTSGVCLSCVSPCNSCLTLSTCSSCRATFFFYNNSCLTDTNCPSGTFANSTSNTCDPCTSPCTTCLFSSSTSCQSCSQGYIFFNTSCLINCPDTYYNNSGTCSSCVPPCGLCTAVNICTSCITNYLQPTTGQCVVASACPAGTYPNATLKECSTCPTGCTACTSPTQCSSCISNIYVFYNFQCLTSCPNTTYKAGSTCQDCSPNCANCANTPTTCTTCTNPSVLHNNICQTNCPAGYFNSSGVCSACLSSCASCLSSTTCTGCPAGTFLSSGQCITSCPAGTYQDTTNHLCSPCSSTCTTCSGSSTTCSSCPINNVLFNSLCIGSCPANYFDVNGVCLTCSNCNTCTSHTTCTQCQLGYFLFGGACYTTCPNLGIPDPITMTCIQCDSTCLTCSGSTTTCTSCKGGTFLYTSSCYSTCPTGLISDPITNTCSTSGLGSIIYFPCLITFSLWVIIIVYSKCNHPKTQTITSLAGGLSFILWFSWLVLIFTTATDDISLQSGQKSIVVGVGMTGVVCSLLLGIAFNCWIKKTFYLDSGFDHWKQRNHYNLYTYRVVSAISCISLPFFRMIYSRFFCRNNFSSFFIDGSLLFLGSNYFTLAFILFCLLPLIFCCAFLIYLKQTYDQTLIYSIDTLILSLILILFLIIDIASKDENFFDQMLEEQPYLKRVKINHEDPSSSCIKLIDQEGKPIYKSELDPKDREDYFRKKVSCIDNLNRFGHLNQPLPQPIATPRRVKSMPNDLSKYPQLDPDDDEDAINSQVWRRDLQQRKRLEDEEEAMRRRREEEMRLKKIQEEEEQARERIRKNMLQDQDERHELQFPDLAAIQKAQGKQLRNMKNSRTMLLKGFKTVDSKPIDPKAQRKLQQISKKNGIDPTFMTQTFCIQGHHNPQLLNSVIDIHHHVKRQSVRNLFSSTNNPQVLQTLFGKHATTDPDRLRALLNDPQSVQIIKRMADKQEGILAPELAQKLLSKDSKYNPQFVKSLLAPSTGMDPQKLKAMLKDNQDPAGQQAALKALKKIGGKNLQNKQLLQNMLGQQSKLNAQAFVRVANDLPKDVIEKLFGQKSEANDTIIQKLLNNPRLDLKKLGPILQDPEVALNLAQALGSQQDSQTLNRVVSDLPPDVITQLFSQPSQTNQIIIDQILKNKKIDLKKVGSLLADPQVNKLLASALSHQNPAVRQNILNLLKNGQNIDPQMLKKMLANPKLIDKLLTRPVDPAFLSSLLSEGANTDLRLLEKSLTQMSPQQMEEVFGFHPERNIDYQKMAQLFEYNPKSDPRLIAQLLEPQMVANLYSKGSSAKAELLNKLVQKGKSINRQQIIKIYGQDPKNNMDKKYLTDHKYNITDSNFNLMKIEEDSQLGFNKMDNNNMSRTSGVAGFLSPIHVSLAKGKGRDKQGRGGSIDDLSDQQVTQYNQDQEVDSDESDEYQIINGVRRKKKKKPKKRKKLEDVRLDAQPIYLRRLKAPHQLKKQQKQRNFRNKKRVNGSMQQLKKMDEDNQVYDLDF